MSCVTLENVTKRFDKAAVVDDVSLDVRDKELLVLVGPSGCGKSTVLRMIAGLEESTSGLIRIGSREVTNLEPRDRNVAMVFQNYALYPHKTVFENLAFGLRMRGVPRREIRRRVNEAAETLSLTGLLSRRPRQLSGGQMQRVALGRALVREPDVFLLDEPLSNLDAKLRAQMREEIGRLGASMKASMIFVTHDQVEAMTLGHRICVMNGGAVQQVGTPLDVYRQPANRFVAGFIGMPEMNFIQGEIAEEATFRSPGIRLSLDPSAHVIPPQGVKVTLGIRPEHVSLVSSAPNIIATVSLVERLGAQTVVVTENDGLRVSALTSNESAVRNGDKVSLSLNERRLHLFEADSGKSLVKLN